MKFDRTDFWILPEYRRKSKSVLLNVRCERCSRRCIIASEVPTGFSPVFVDKLAAVFSSLCDMLDVDEQSAPDTGQISPTSDAGE